MRDYRMWAIAAALGSAPLSAATQSPTPQPFAVADLTRVEELSEPIFAPDGNRLVYVVTSAGSDDQSHSALWSAPWEGGTGKPLTRGGAGSDWHPQFSRDGRILAFLHSGAHDSDVQLWTMNSRGGEVRRVSRLPGGISDYALAPDGRRAVVVAEVGDAVGSKAKTPPPIVVNRFQFKFDGRDWLDDRRQHLFLVDLATGAATQLTHGDFDHWLPSWSPDGRWIAFVSKRCEEADRHLCSDIYVMPAQGGEMRRISRFDGADGDPEWEAGRPEWSPDSKKLVWLQAGAEQLTWYTPFQLAVADVATGVTQTPARIDRWFYFPRWSSDGRHILALIEQDRDTWLAQIDPGSGSVDYLTGGARFAMDFAVGTNGRLAVLDGDVHTPAALRAVGAISRPLSNHNGWITQRRFAETRDISFLSGGAEIHGLLTLPPDHRDGQRHPLVVRLHGGPVYQFSHELLVDWQVYAARGYAVLAINPRGSSGRGAAFAQAQMANWGSVDVADISAGIDKVVASGVADAARIGVGGWSYGGALTDYMIARDSRIRAAVSGAGMANFIAGYGTDEYARDYELELGTPWQNPDLWRRLSYPFLEVEKITAPTLFLCAAKDMNVPCLGSEQMYQALRSRGVPTGLVIYPGENHHLTVPTYLRDRLQRQIDWYDRYLGVATPIK